MLTSSAGRIWVLLLGLSVCVPLTARAQTGDEIPPPLLSERTEDQVHKLLSLAPGGPYSGPKPALRTFTISRVAPADLLALLIASFASLCLVAPGAFLIFASREWSAAHWQPSSKGVGVLAALSLAWMLFLYSLAFSRNAHSRDVFEKEILVSEPAAAPGSIFIGDLRHWGLRGLGSQWTAGKLRYPLRRMGDTIPEIHFMSFQMTLFLQALVPLLLLVGRRRGAAGSLLFGLLWSITVYAPVTYWTQGGGWLADCVDAGSSVPLFLCMGFTALGLALSQRRPGASTDSLLASTDSAAGSSAMAEPRYLVLGGLLFVSGSLLLAGARALVFHPSSTWDFLNVLVATSVGFLTWTVLGHRSRADQSPSPLLGAVAGVTSSAAGCASVTPVFTVLIALVAATASYAVLRRKTSEASGAAWHVFAIYGVSALAGLLLTGVFASVDVAGLDNSGRPIVGLIGGNFELWRIQALTGSVAALLALAVGFALPKIFDTVALVLTRREQPKMVASETRVDDPIVAVK